MIQLADAVLWPLVVTQGLLTGGSVFERLVVTPLVSPARGWLGRAQPGVGAIGHDGFLRRPDLAEEVISALEARALWARYGL